MSTNKSNNNKELNNNKESRHYLHKLIRKPGRTLLVKSTSNSSINQNLKQKIIILIL